MQIFIRDNNVPTLFIGLDNNNDKAPATSILNGMRKRN